MHRRSARRVKDLNEVDNPSMKLPFPSSKLALAISLAATVVGIGTMIFAAEQKQARLTEVIRDVRLLAGQTAARSAAVNDTVREGTAVRTGTDSRAELTFTDQTLTRLGANTVFSFGGAARTYDLGSGAILMSAPKQAGTVKITTAVATCAVSGFTMISEYHGNTWNKVLMLNGDGYVSLRRNPGDKRHMHSSEILIFRPNATVLPQPQQFDICNVISNGRLITGFTRRLPEWPALVNLCERQRSEPVKKKLIDPMSQDIIDQAINARPEAPPPPRPTIIPSGERLQ
jgi:hypothetical protein